VKGEEEDAFTPSSATSPNFSFAPLAVVPFPVLVSAPVPDPASEPVPVTASVTVPAPVPVPVTASSSVALGTEPALPGPGPEPGCRGNCCGNLKSNAGVLKAARALLTSGVKAPTL